MLFLFEFYRPLAMQMTTTHKEGVTCCCYNSSFNHVVTSSENSVIKVWDIENGDQVFEYTDVHDQTAVTDMCFDSTERRFLFFFQLEVNFPFGRRDTKVLILSNVSKF